MWENIMLIGNLCRIKRGALKNAENIEIFIKTTMINHIREKNYDIHR
jgi:hypothetical protein